MAGFLTPPIQTLQLFIKTDMAAKTVTSYIFSSVILLGCEESKCMKIEHLPFSVWSVTTKKFIKTQVSHEPQLTQSYWRLCYDFNSINKFETRLNVPSYTVWLTSSKYILVNFFAPTRNDRNICILNTSCSFSLGLRLLTTFISYGKKATLDNTHDFNEF